MKTKKWMLSVLLLALLLGGCSMGTVSKMYCLPKRSELYADVQKAIDQAMVNLSYCAPRSGEYQQPVQMADLDGDGGQEYLVFAKENGDLPLKILIFDQVDKDYCLVDSIESNGTNFDQVAYVQMDDHPGLELVVGRQLSNEVPRSVSVYTFSGDSSQRLLKTNYARILTTDLDMDNRTELFVLRPGESETDNGIAELYGIENGTMERSNEVRLSAPSDKLKRLIPGRMAGENAAVYVASELDGPSLVTDVFAWNDGSLRNVSFSNDSGTSVQTTRNYFVYADDIDNDGVVELPDLLPMQSSEELSDGKEHNLIRWYAMELDGSEEDKMYTYHDFIGGWYFELNPIWATRLTVQQTGNAYAFYIWSESYEEPRKVMTIYALTGQNRDAQRGGGFTLLKTDSVTYVGELESGARYFGITRDSMVHNFHLIQPEWKTGET